MYLCKKYSSHVESQNKFLYLQRCNGNRHIIGKRLVYSESRNLDNSLYSKNERRSPLTCIMLLKHNRQRCELFLSSVQAVESLLIRY